MSIGDLRHFAPTENAGISGPQPQVMRGQVETAPASAADDLVVSERGYGAANAFPVPGGQWVSEGASMPQVGSVCLIIKDDYGDRWCIVAGTADESLRERVNQLERQLADLTSKVEAR